jgi:hypothetical protein
MQSCTDFLDKTIVFANVEGVKARIALEDSVKAFRAIGGIGQTVGPM